MGPDTVIPGRLEFGFGYMLRLVAKGKGAALDRAKAAKGGCYRVFSERTKV